MDMIIKTISDKQMYEWKSVWNYGDGDSIKNMLHFLCLKSKAHRRSGYGEDCVIELASITDCWWTFFFLIAGTKDSFIRNELHRMVWSSVLDLDGKLGTIGHVNRDFFLFKSLWGGFLHNITNCRPHNHSTSWGENYSISSVSHNEHHGRTN